MKKKFLSTLALSIIVFSSSSPIYADNIDNDSKPMTTVTENVHCPKDEHHHKHGHKYKNKKIIVQYLKEKHKMTDKEIQAQLSSGKSLKTILNENKVNTQELRDYMLKDKFNRIDEAVKNGELSEEKANKLKQRIRKRVEQRHNSQGQER